VEAVRRIPAVLVVTMAVRSAPIVFFFQRKVHENSFSAPQTSQRAKPLLNIPSHFPLPRSFRRLDLRCLRGFDGQHRHFSFYKLRTGIRDTNYVTEIMRDVIEEGLIHIYVCVYISRYSQVAK